MTIVTTGLLLFLLFITWQAFAKKKILATSLSLTSFLLYFLIAQKWFLIYSILMSCIILGIPLFVMIGMIVVAVFLTFTNGYDDFESFTFLIRKIQEISNKEVLLAVPFFVVAGEIMTRGSLAKQLIAVAKSLFCWLPGGMAVAAVFGCIFFAAISGSSPVTVIAIGSIMVPALSKFGYNKDFSIGLLTSSGSLGILIPPSIPMIIYALMVSSIVLIDPTDLFLAGVGPGLLMGLLLSSYAVFWGIKEKYPTQPFSFAELLIKVREGFWSLLLPVIILGGIYTGIFTPTEGAAVSVVYALIVEILILQELKFGDLVDIAQKSMIMVGSLLLIMSLALGLNHFFVLEQIPDAIVAWIEHLDLNRFSFLLMINIFLLLVGAVMDIISAILILAPMLAPMAVAMNIDPLHMGIIFIVNLEIGYLTPPVGLNLFVASTLFKRPLGSIIKSVMPMLAVMFIGLFLITWIEPISTGLVKFTKSFKQSDNDSSSKVKSMQELMMEADEQ